MRVYFNTSALNRPLDDLLSDRVRLEAEAVVALLAAVERGADLLITTDDRMIRRAGRATPDLRVRVVTPQEALIAASGRRTR
jgi:predicted nucleic acid-binding protein